VVVFLSRGLGLAFGVWGLTFPEGFLGWQPWTTQTFAVARTLGKLGRKPSNIVEQGKLN
jgi:hypothetical protein